MGLIETLDKIFPVGFHIAEEMRGTHHFAKGMGPEGEHPLHFELLWGKTNVAKKGPMAAGGTITVGGLVENATCYGTLELNYLSEGKLRYTLHFIGDGIGHLDRGEYTYIGEKVNIKLWNLAVSHTTCFGTIVDGAGHLVSRSVTHFEMSTAWGFLKSFGVDFGGPK